MLELALNILDVAENSVRAGASLIEITVDEQLAADRLVITIADNGCGMDASQLAHVSDPFFSTKKVRRIGLGVPLLKQEAEVAGGSFTIESEPGKGTRVNAIFQHSHLDRQPLGDVAGAITTLMIGAPEIDLLYRHLVDEREFCLDTRDLRDPDLSFSDPAILRLIAENVREGLAEIGVRG